jgi:hypothetical protein
MRPERMTRAEFGDLILDERRNPVRISFVDLPGNPDEGHEVSRVSDFPDLQGW